MAASITPQRERNQSWRWQAMDLLANAATLLLLYFAYDAVRRITADDWSTAFDNGRRLLAFQQELGLPSEASLQRPLILRPFLARGANAFYMWGHFPLTSIFMLWVWFRHRPFFGVIRNNLIALTGAGLILHVIFPLAPPRFFAGYVDTAARFGPSPYDLDAAKAANQIAAMPSLHVGWAVLVAISVIALSTRRWRYLILLHPIVTTLVVVVTANHYWSDAIIAIVLVSGSWILTVRLARLGLFSFRKPTSVYR